MDADESYDFSNGEEFSSEEDGFSAPESDEAAVSNGEIPDAEWDTFVQSELEHGGKSQPAPAEPSEKPTLAEQEHAPVASPSPLLSTASHYSESSSSVYSSSSSSSSSSSTSALSGPAQAPTPAAKRNNEIDDDHLVPKVPKQPRQPANVWRFVDTELMALYQADEDDFEVHSYDEAHSGGHERAEWRSKLLDLDDFDRFRKNELTLDLEDREATN